jgi:hypothetical protein
VRTNNLVSIVAPEGVDLGDNLLRINIDTMHVEPLANQHVRWITCILLKIGHVVSECRHVNTLEYLVVARNPTLFGLIKSLLKIDLVSCVKGAIPHVCKVFGLPIENIFLGRTLRMDLTGDK